MNTFPGLVHTARHIMKAVCTRSHCANSQERQMPKVWMVIGMKSSQGSRRGTCGWITSFLRRNHGSEVKIGLPRSTTRKSRAAQSHRTIQFLVGFVLSQVETIELQQLDAAGTQWRGCSSVGRAVALQAIGQEFESPQLHQPLIAMKVRN